MANTKQSNPKFFCKSKFAKANQPKSDKDCTLGVHTASNQHDEKEFEYYWCYKNHVPVDCITGLPIFEMTTGANVADSTVALDILSRTNEFLPIQECSFLADKGYDVKAIYNTVKNTYFGDCVIPLNSRGTKDCKKLPIGNPICEARLAMHRDGKFTDKGRTRQKFCCPFRQSKTSECPCTHKIGTTARKIEVVLSILQFQMITGFLSTEAAKILRKPTRSAPNVNDSCIIANPFGDSFEIAC